MFDALNTPDWAKRTDILCTPPIGATRDQLNAHHEQWHPTPSTEFLAKSLCDGCPALNDCREFAINFECPTYGPLTGVIGGTTTDERAKERRNRQDRKRYAKKKAVA